MKLLPSLPTSITWQPGYDSNLVIGTESGLVVLQDYRFCVGNPVAVQVHTRLVHRLAFSPHWLVVHRLNIILLEDYWVLWNASDRKTMLNFA